MKILLYLLILSLAACSVSTPPPAIEKTYNTKSLQAYAFAEQAFQDNKFADALRLFRLALRSDPQSNEIQLRIIETQDILGSEYPDYNDSLIKAATEFIVHGNKHWRIMSMLATAYARQKNYDQAIHYLEKSLKIHPDAHNYYRLYVIYSAYKNIDKPELLEDTLANLSNESRPLAQTIIQQVAKFDAWLARDFATKAYAQWQDSVALEYLVDFYYENLEEDKAFNLLKEHINNELSISKELADWFLKQLLRQKDYAYIRDNVDIFMTPHSAENSLLYIMSLQKTENYATCLVEIKKHLSNFTPDKSTQVELDLVLVDAYYERGEYEKVAQILVNCNKWEFLSYVLAGKDFPAEHQDKVIKLKNAFAEKPSWQEYIMLDAASKQDDANLMEQLLGKINPAACNDSINIIYARYALDYHLFEAAKKFYAHQNFFTDDLAYFATQHYFSTQNYTDALFYMQKQIKKSPEAELYNMLAEIYRLQKNHPEMIKTLEKGIELFPENASLLNSLGYLLVLHTSKYSRAEKLLQAALLLTPEAEYIWDSMAWLYYQKGDYKKALEYMSHIVETGIDTSETANHMGQILFELKIYTQARVFLGYAVRINDNDAAVAAARKTFKIIKSQELK